MADTEAGSPAGSAVARLRAYIRTRKGTILAAEIFLGLIILICYAASRYGGYTAVAICEMVFAIIFFVIFMMDLDKQFTVLHWPWTDFFRAVIGAALYLITSLICVISTGDGARTAGGVFGLVAGILYSYDSYLSFLSLRASRQHTAASTALASGTG
uniref:Proteolipid protein 2 n=1 Tax=Lepisosteus oculatus TaxID=7918 RepID=W5NC21_LEPOC